MWGQLCGNVRPVRSATGTPRDSPDSPLRKHAEKFPRLFGESLRRLSRKIGINWYPMKTPTFEEISFRAYHLWESRGRPDGQDAAIGCWLQAERSLWDDAAEREYLDGRATDGYEFHDQGEPAEGIPSNVKITDLDRALPADQRRSARDERRRKKGVSSNSFETRPERERVLVVVNRGHVRIYSTDSEAPELAAGFDLPGGERDYTDNDTDQAGRFPGAGSRGMSPGGSIDERLPMQEERLRRLAKEAAQYIATFLDEHPRARWKFAAGPALHRPILNQIAPGRHARLEQAISKDLMNLPLPELLRHFEPQVARS